MKGRANAAASTRVERVAQGISRWAVRLAAFSMAHAKTVILLSWILAIGSALLSAHLTLDAGFAALIPPSAESVRHLHALERRLRVPGTYMIGVEANDPESLAATRSELLTRAADLDPSLVSGITADRKVVRDFIWSHRWLYVPIGDLEAARDSIQARIGRASPFDLGIDDAEIATEDGTTALQQRLDDAKREAQDPGAFVAKDGRLALILLRTTFGGGDVEHGRTLTAQLRELGSAVERAHPGARVGLAGDIITTLVEHDALLRGMLLSTLVTVALVLGALLLFYRSVLAVGAVTWALCVGVLATFACTRFFIGHLNIASAFLSSIVIGNGINFGLVLLGRYLEERSSNIAVPEAIERAARGTAPGTLAAALAATVAYGSLALTQFRGFRDFGLIGASGMLLCWLAAYVVVPAALLILGERIRGRSGARLGRALAWLVPERPQIVAGIGLGLLVVTLAFAVRYVTHDPLEQDLRNLRSQTSALDEASRWMDKFDRAFGHGLDGGFAIGVERRADAASVAEKLRAVDANKPERAQLFSSIHTLDDALPADQQRKLSVLVEIRSLLAPRLLKHLSADERRRLAELDPPESLAPVRDQDLPSEISWPFTERDGARGRIVLANTGLAVDSWSVPSLVQFAHTVRSLNLGPEVVIGGSAFVFSDMLEAMQRDGPRATLAAIIGCFVVVFVLFRGSKAALVTLICAALGTMGLLSAADWLGLKVNFLDFVALPITIGIGVDYAVNIAARARDAAGPRPGRAALIATGPVVVLCSYTTIVGYASLLFSQNRGIKSFGLSAMLGELTCIAAAVLLAPALLDFRLPRSKYPT